MVKMLVSEPFVLAVATMVKAMIFVLSMVWSMVSEPLKAAVTMVKAMLFLQKMVELVLEPLVKAAATMV